MTRPGDPSIWRQIVSGSPTRRAWAVSRTCRWRSAAMMRRCRGTLSSASVRGGGQRAGVVMAGAGWCFTMLERRELRPSALPCLPSHHKSPRIKKTQRAVAEPPGAGADHRRWAESEQSATCAEGEGHPRLLPPPTLWHLPRHRPASFSSPPSCAVSIQAPVAASVETLSTRLSQTPPALHHRRGRAGLLLEKTCSRRRHVRVKIAGHYRAAPTAAGARAPRAISQCPNLNPEPNPRLC